MRIVALAVAVAPLLLATPAFAACRCECVDGKAQAICDYSYESKSYCSQLCPMAPAALKPIPPIVTPPVGMTCDQKQVLNTQTKRYEWRSVCE